MMMMRSVRCRSAKTFGMPQTAYHLTPTATVAVELPSPEDVLMPGIAWGAVDAFPKPAYWLFQVLARRLGNMQIAYRLGRSLAEEVGACLLGGHGIPAAVGLAAYERLRERGAFGPEPPPRATLEAWLREPLSVRLGNTGTRQVRYRFAAQKARYLSEALPQVRAAPEFSTGRALRAWLDALPGIGPKTASWIARNAMDADDVAILDIHILRVGRCIGLFPRELTVERHYLQLEALFLQFSQALGVRPSELDAVIWFEMSSSPHTVRWMIEEMASQERAIPSGAERAVAA